MPHFEQNAFTNIKFCYKYVTSGNFCFPQTLYLNANLECKIIPGKGFGILATEFIPKHTLIVVTTFCFFFL